MEDKIIYVIPDYGPQEIKLYPLTKKIVSFLEETGEIDRQKKQPNLGLIGKKYEGLQYSRWDYVLTQMFFTQYIKEHLKIQRIGLNSNQKICNETFSKIDLFNSLSVIKNLGHLYNTFADERIFFEILLDDKNIQSYIEKEIGEEFSEKFRKIIERGRFFSFHNFIAILFIKKEYAFKNETIAKCMLDILDKWINKRLKEKSKTVFEEIRNLSFVYLDTNMTFSFIKANTNLLLQTLKLEEEKFFFDENSELKNLRDGLESFLIETLYSSIEQNSLLFNYIAKGKELIKKTLKKSKDKGRKFLELMFDYRNKPVVSNIFNIKEPEKKYSHYKRLNFKTTLDIRNKKELKFYNVQKKLNKNKNIKYFLDPDVMDYYKEDSRVDIFYNRKLKIEDRKKIVFDILSYLKDFYINNRIILEYELKKVFEEITKISLDIILKEKYKVVFENETDRILIKLKEKEIEEIEKELKEEITHLEKYEKNNYKGRKNEIESLKETFIHIKNKNGTIIIPLTNIKIIKEENGKKEDKAEFDGVIIQLINKKLRIFLVEAKKRMKKSRKSEEELKKKIEKVCRKNLRKEKEISSKKHYTHIMYEF